MGLASGRFRVVATRDTGCPPGQTGAVTSPHAEPRLADVLELPRVCAASESEPAGQGDERETETLILLW